MTPYRLTSILISRYFLELGAFNVNAGRYGNSYDVSDETFALHFNPGPSGTPDLELAILPPNDCDCDWANRVERPLNGCEESTSGCLDSESSGDDGYNGPDG